MQRTVNRSYAEAKARDALRDYLLSSPASLGAFLEALDVGAPWRELNKEVSIRTEVATDTGKRIDLLLTNGLAAMVLELKIDHRENPFQYAGYRRFLVRTGFVPTVIGVVRTRKRTRGREALNAAILDQLADRRITWAELITRLGKVHPGRETSGLRRSLERIGVSLVVTAPDVPAAKITCLDITKVDSDPAHLAGFFAAFVAEVGSNFTAYPDQAGNSPPMLRFGRTSWGEWFGDGNAERIFLMVDHSRGSKAMPETEFSFGITLWDKNACGHRSPPLPDNVREAAALLSQSGFRFERNRPGTYKAINWRDPFRVHPTGFFYANAQGDVAFKVTMCGASRRGTAATILTLATEAQRIASILDGLAAAPSSALVA